MKRNPKSEICILNTLFCVFILFPVSAFAQLSERMPWEIETETKTAPDWKFSTTYRLEIGFYQPNQRSDSTANNTFLNGGKVGFLVDFNLPYNLGIQTGLRYELTYGTNTQHFRSADNNNVTTEYIRHRIFKHALSIPIYAAYTQQLWRELSLTLYTGPDLQIGLACTDDPISNLSDSTLSWLQNKAPDPTVIKTYRHDYYTDHIYNQFNIRWSIGGGLQWLNYRLQGGYNFGLNNIALYQPNTGNRTNLHEWSWEVSFIYTFNYKLFDPQYYEKAYEKAKQRKLLHAQNKEKQLKKRATTTWHFGTDF